MLLREMTASCGAWWRPRRKPARITHPDDRAARPRPHTAARPAPSSVIPMTARTTYLLVDGENIDATLGVSVLGRRPQPDERPRWNKLLQHAEHAWHQPVRGLFFLAVGDSLPSGFVQALIALGYKAIPLRGEGKVVDIAIQRTAEALLERDADVMLVSHDNDFTPQMEALAQDEGRRLGVVGFGEFMAGGLRQVDGVEFFDLEYDVSAFKSRLPRVRVIEIDEFDPLEFI